VTDLNLQSFNLVTQADSTIMKAESGSMKIIAAMTLVFLPCTAVAVSDAFLSKQFFFGTARPNPVSDNLQHALLLPP
jgi:hypothetical protein